MSDYMAYLAGFVSLPILLFILACVLMARDEAREKCRKWKYSRRNAIRKRGYDQGIADGWDEGYDIGVSDGFTSMDWTDGQVPPARINPHRPKETP
ncbi:hypothetical protein ACTXM8_10175 [Brachybacterium alimentarium]|uniref:hypothetical protein n=1 Tax=Brachybacterium alimentarium TaxID=47845 RepID=UPI003FCEF984